MLTGADAPQAVVFIINVFALFANHCVSELIFDVTAAENQQVTKDIALLKDMLKQLEKECEEEEMYDQLACWCETNDRERTKAIADAEATIEDVFSHTFQQVWISVSEHDEFGPAVVHHTCF